MKKHKVMFGNLMEKQYMGHLGAVGKVKVNLSLCFNWAPHHEGVREEWKYSSTHSWPRHYMEVGGQLHTSVSLSPGKERLVLIW
jgi:hypothetical protein